jgi:hypothetical protein
MKKKICFLQICPENKNKNHFDILKSKNSDFLFATFKKNNNDSTIFSPLSQSNYTNTIIKLINKVPKIYDYYCIINYNIIFEDINILDKIIEAIDRYSPPILNISNNTNKKKFSVEPFISNGIKIIHNSLLNYFFKSDYFDYANNLFYNILEIPFLDNLVTINNINYYTKSDDFCSHIESKFDKQKLWCSLYPYIQFRFEIKDKFKMIPNKIEEHTSYTNVEKAIKYFVDKYKNKECKKSNLSNFFNINHISKYFDLNHPYFRDIINKPKRSDTLIVLGNGPSLKKEYFDFIRNYDVDTFGLNAAYRFFKEINWYPTYFGCFDYSLTYSHKKSWNDMILDDKNSIEKYFLLEIPSNESHIRDIYSNQGLTYFNDKIQRHSRYVGRLHNQDGIHWPEFGTKKNKLSCTGVNAIRTGIELGYKNIIMIGHDANYKPPKFFKDVSNEGKHVYKFNDLPKKNPNYFLDNYQQKGDVYCDPGNVLPVWSRFSELVKKYNSLSGTKVNIYNCSKISEIKEFPKEDFHYLIEKLCKKKNINNDNGQ